MAVFLAAGKRESDLAVDICTIVSRNVQTKQDKVSSPEANQSMNAHY